MTTHGRHCSRRVMAALILRVSWAGMLSIGAAAAGLLGWEAGFRPGPAEATEAPHRAEIPPKTQPRLDNRKIPPGRQGIESAYACEDYAQDALRDIAAARRAGCDLGGPRYTTSHDEHFNWCMAVGSRNTKGEQQARKREVAACLSRGDGQAPATLEPGSSGEFGIPSLTPGEPGNVQLN